MGTLLSGKIKSIVKVDYLRVKFLHRGVKNSIFRYLYHRQTKAIHITFFHVLDSADTELALGNLSFSNV